MVFERKGSSRIALMLSCALLTVAALPQRAHAQATTTVTFNALTESSPGSGTRYIGNCHAESGFLFTAVGLPCSGDASLNTFLAGGANSPLFGGGATPSLLLNSPDASVIRVTRTDNAAFSFASIALAPFDGAQTTILFTGIRDGGNVTSSVTVMGGLAGFQVFSFDDLFTGVTAIEIAASNEFGEPLVKFDDFSAMSAQNVVPEPGTIALLGVGLIGVAGIARRKRGVS